MLSATGSTGSRKYWFISQFCGFFISASTFSQNLSCASNFFFLGRPPPMSCVRGGLIALFGRPSVILESRRMSGTPVGPTAKVWLAVGVLGDCADPAAGAFDVEVRRCGIFLVGCSLAFCAF